MFLPFYNNFMFWDNVHKYFRSCTRNMFLEVLLTASEKVIGDECAR
jgi:hypothetical protein